MWTLCRQNAPVGVQHQASTVRRPRYKARRSASSRAQEQQQDVQLQEQHDDTCPAFASFTPDFGATEYLSTAAPMHFQLLPQQTSLTVNQWPLAVWASMGIDEPDEGHCTLLVKVRIAQQV